MKNVSCWLSVAVMALALWMASAATVQAQVVYYQPAPVVPVAPVTTYYAPPPVVSYYAPAPVVQSYYVPALVPVVSSYYVAPAAVTTYRYGPFGRLRGVSNYYGAPAPVVTRYGYYYP